MHHFTPRGQQHDRNSVPQFSVEVLEDRRLFSGSVFTAFDTTSSPVAGLSVNATAGRKFKDVVGNWTTASGLPTPDSGMVAIATVDWGDGKTTHAKLVDDGSGVVQIIGAHAWRQPGTFQTVVKVQEYPKGHRTQLTDIGEGDGSAVVAPKPHKVSVKGTFTGTYASPLNNPDARSYDFTGTGTAGAVGAADLGGTITPPGFIRTAPATGELTLTGADGSVTLDVTGKTQPGGSPLPQKLTYMITGGTGTFANTAAKGSMSVALDTTASTFVIVVH
jgi:hypothetical protein